MHLKPILTTVLGLAFAGGSLLISEGMFAAPQATERGDQTQAAQAEPEMIRIVSAAVDIPFGTEITPDLLEMIDHPKGDTPDSAFRDPYALLGPAGTLPRSATQDIRAGDPIIVEQVSRFGETVTLTRALPDALRAIAIKVSAETAVGGFVAPGDRVDIVLTEGRGEDLRTGTILQDIRVLGIDQDAESAQDARNITVEVTPRQGQILALSQQAGVLSLTLRNNRTRSTDTALEQITMADVWGIATAMPPEPTAKPQIVDVNRILVRRGLVQEEVVVE